MPTVRPRSGASFYPLRRPAVAVVLALTAAGLAIAAPTASATVWRAVADDPVDAGLSAGRDVVRAELTYDDVAGTASTTIALRGVPTGDRAFALVLGRKDGAGVCGSPALALVSVAVGGGTGGSWKLLDAGGGEVASGNEVVLQENASSVTVSGASPAFAGGVYDCAEVQTLDASTGGGTVRDMVTFSALAADPSSVPPAPPTPPSPGPTPPAPPAPTSPAPKKAPALRVTTTGLPKTVVRGRSYRVTVRVDNVGTAAAKQLRLSVARTPGVRATPTRAVWKRLSAGKGVTRRVTVRATTTRTRMLRLRVIGRGKLSATATLRVVPKIAQRKTAPTKRKTPAKATPAKAPLAGRYFWGFKTQLDRGWDNYAVLFVDDRWAYVGFPEDGVPTCTAAVAEGDGCRRYTLDAKSGALKVGEFEGTWKDESGGSLTFDGLRMSELAFAKPGTRYALSLQHKNFSGQCGFTTGCTTWSRSFALNAEGHFVSSGSSVSSLGGSGTPYVWSGAFPSDETGSYEILTRGRIRLSYLNGKVEVFTLGLELDKQGRPAPATNGLLLGSTNFYD